MSSAFEQPFGDFIEFQNIPETPPILSDDNGIELGLRNRFRRLCIGGHLVIDSAFSELEDGLSNATTLGRKADLSVTSGLTIGGQIYERVRLPEVIGISVTTNIYKEMLESGTNSTAATAVSSVALGLLVYSQQKIIGKNFVKTAEYYPETYATVNQMWPKSMQAISEAIPSKDNPISEGIGMVGLGTTPFIASAKAANPEISNHDLNAIERRVTRRGSIAAAVIAATVLGTKSSAVHLPITVAEKAIKWSDELVDFVSSPLKLIGALGLWSGVKIVTKATKHKLGNH